MKLEEIKGIGPKTKALLHKLNILTIDDLVSYYPFRYEQLIKSDFHALNQDDKIVIDGMVETMPSVFYIKRNLDKMTFRLSGEGLMFQVTVFNRGFMKSKITPGTIVTVVGKYDKQKTAIVASDIKLGGIPTPSPIEGVYHSLQGVSGKQMKSFIEVGLKENFEVEDAVPTIFSEKYHFIPKKEAVREVHNPSSIERLSKARQRLKYEELFLFMMQMNYLKKNKEGRNGIAKQINWEAVMTFISKLSFPLTPDQLQAVTDIYQNMTEENAMNRLLQGDVGSGKTIVSVIAMYMNHLAGYTSALMVPTEVLATQHARSIQKVLASEHMKVVLLTGKLKVSEKKKIIAEIEEGHVHVVIGTHALITETVQYQNLGLVITDEQHRFGVGQRSHLKNKGQSPDVLYMSATPIPRTYALTLYGDMDISSIKTMPKGRISIQTMIRSDQEITDVLERMLVELKKGHQIYVIVPLIEESDKIELENTQAIYDKLTKAFGKYYKLGMLHGKMKPQEKEQSMQEFKDNETQILVSTTVIEVGVDVANATMIVIFDAFRFGLSTLHQLRGRVGRNQWQSYCILVSAKETKRLDILTKTNDGFLVSEEDFKLRGSGDLFGNRQSGDMSFGIADIKKDFNILVKAKEDSEQFLESEEYKNLSRNHSIRKKMAQVNDLD